MVNVVSDERDENVGVIVVDHPAARLRRLTEQARSFRDWKGAGA